MQSDLVIWPVSSVQYTHSNHFEHVYPSTLIESYLASHFLYSHLIINICIKEKRTRQDNSMNSPIMSERRIQIREYPWYSNGNFGWLYTTTNNNKQTEKKHETRRKKKPKQNKINVCVMQQQKISSNRKTL